MPRTGSAHDPPSHHVQGDTQNADFSVCYCYCLTEYTAQLGGLLGQREMAIQVHQLVEKFCETKTIQYNSNDNCYVFCYKNQIETRQASGWGEKWRRCRPAVELMKNYVRHMPHDTGQANAF